MALKLFLGNSGSGKTEYIYEQVVRQAEANPKKNYLCLVPEQYTMQTQRKLVDLSSNQAIMNIDVLSFQRLAYRVFDELGVDGLDILEETGKNLVLRKIAQEKEASLQVLRGNMHRMGYIGEVKSLISELMQYNISPSQLEECIKEKDFSPVLKNKLSDVQTIYQGFVDFLKERYITAEELLHVLAQKADDSVVLRDSVLVLDEFTGFTPVQIELLRKLMPICDEIWVSLTIDAREDFFHSRGMHELFDMPKKTIHALLTLARETQTDVLEPVVLKGGEDKRYKDAKALYFMEQNLFRSRYQRMLGKTDEIQLISVRNPKDELIFAARKINQLVQKEGYRYKDIAVVSADITTYANYVQEVCSKYNIPYFLDMTREVLFHPFIEFVRAILEVINGDFSYHAIMRLLRCGYSGIEEDGIDRLENYLLATGIRGKNKWNEKWLTLIKGMEAAELEYLNQMRDTLIRGLMPVVEVFHKKSTVREQLHAIYTYIVSLHVEEALVKKEAELLAEGEQVKAKEYGQIYRIVMDLFDKCVRVLGDDVMSIRELEEILDAGFEAAKVAVIPPGYDNVTIGDIERTRLNHVKILIFLGVNEGIVPKNINQGGIISAYERSMLAEADITLSPSAREQAFIQKYYLYLNMTKPSRQLYICYSRVGSDGKALLPSYLIRNIQQLFPDMQVQEFEDMSHTLETSTKEAAKDYFLEYADEKYWYALAKCFTQSDDEKFREQSRAVLDAFYYEYKHNPISEMVAEAIYGRHIEGSVTRLEQFARCAYAHFLSYGLHLRERQESGFESVDMGNLYHEALEIYSKRLEESQYNWRNIPDEIRDLYAHEAMQDAILKYPNMSIYATAENKHMAVRMEQIFSRTVWALTAQVRKGDFEPEGFEVSFSNLQNLHELQVELEDDHFIKLRGRIDRMDVLQEDNHLYVKVIDYKSGSTKFDLLKIYRGLQLQLVVYLDAAMELLAKQHEKKDIIPAGMLYYHIDEPVIKLEKLEETGSVEELLLKELKPDGIVSSDEKIYRGMDRDFEKKSDVIPVELKKDGDFAVASSVASQDEFNTLITYVRNKIVETGNEIYAGNIKIAPEGEGQTSACAYCPYRAVCGFDTRIAGFTEKHGKKIDKKDILEQMETDNAMS